MCIPWNTTYPMWSWQSRLLASEPSAHNTLVWEKWNKIDLSPMIPGIKLRYIQPSPVNANHIDQAFHAKTEGENKELPYLENELWHKIYAATDLETCRANRTAFHDMLSRDWDAAWKFLFSDSDRDDCKPLKPPRDWPMMILMLREKKIPENIRSKICNRMARFKNPSLLREASQAGCRLSAEVAEYAICYGSLECLRWACENGCGRSELDYLYAQSAASYGFLDILKYLRLNNFYWDELTMDQALHGGHLDCLKFAHENCCPWSTELFRARYQRVYWTKNHWDCMQYLIDTGCPPSDSSAARWW